MRNVVTASAGTLVWAALIACYLHSGIVLVAATDESTLPKQNDDTDSQMDISKRDWNRNLHSWGKRAWQNLQGGWGKRDLWGPSSSYPLYVTEKRAWQNLQGGWGKRFAPEEEYAIKLAALMDEIEGEQALQRKLQQTPSSTENGDAENQVDDEKMRDMYNRYYEKRNKWDNFRGSWGKRDAAWNNLKGIWGKRSFPDIAQ